MTDVLDIDAPTRFLTVGPGTGESTAARRIEAERGAVRRAEDEGIEALHGAEDPARVSDVVEGRLITIGLRVLELGVDVRRRAPTSRSPGSPGDTVET